MTSPMSMNRAIHGAFRRDLDRFGTALAAFPAGDAKRAGQLKTAWDHFNFELTRHHLGEHDIAWPALRQLGVSSDLLDQMDAEHDRLAAALKTADAAMSALVATPTTEAATAAGEAITTLRTVADEHMSHEEAEIEPVYQAKKDTPQMKQMGRQFSRGNLLVSGNFMAWVQNGASEDEMAGLRDNVPGPILAIFGNVVGMQYRRQVAPVWKS
ncbi:MAG TPA: hemerythrin domain-containing protein [Kribbellaceae bacterium]|nr:hemerythrin domain-containing protein [Kribbellaceae bacterium]